MKRVLIWACALILFHGIWTGCEDDQFEKSIYNPTPEELNEVGQWAFDNYVVPYNIEVLYRWVDPETDVSKNLTPPRLDTVVPFLKMLHTVWITPYLEMCGPEAMKPIFPKQIHLYGSAGWNQDGTQTLGTADGGKKLILFNLDEYNPKDRAALQEIIHVVHHEFGHLLHQTKEYPLAFKRITPDSYTAGWYNNGSSTALNSGFVTPYAMAEPDEDFAETLSEYLTDTPAEWDQLMAEASAAGRTAILKKLDMVRTYMEENWGVDIDLLRTQVNQRIDNVVAGNYK